VVAAIIRKGEVIVPRGVSTFEEGDEVLAVTDPEGTRLLNDLFSKPEKHRNGVKATVIRKVA
jgi:trk system potassium uptake protein TrkA